MSGGQMTLALPTFPDPATCPHREDVPGIGAVLCHSDGRDVYTHCTEGLCGEPPHCAWGEPDNSPEACERRIKWLREHEKED